MSQSLPQAAVVRARFQVCLIGISLRVVGSRSMYHSSRCINALRILVSTFRHISRTVCVNTRRSKRQTGMLKAYLPSFSTPIVRQRLLCAIGKLGDIHQVFHGLWGLCNFRVDHGFVLLDWLCKCTSYNVNEDMGRGLPDSFYNFWINKSLQSKMARPFSSGLT